MSFNRRGVKVPPTHSEAEAARVVFDVLASGARSYQAGFTKPDDDWFPVWLVVTNQHGTIFTGNEHKHLLTKRVGAFAKRVGAIAIGHLHSSWAVGTSDVSWERMKEIHTTMLAQGGDSTGIPERREILLLAVYTNMSSATYNSPIIRHPDRPPLLGEFRQLPEGAQLTGAMVDPLRAGLRRTG